MEKKNVLYIHNSKCAGISLRSSLIKPSKGSRCWGHVPASQACLLSETIYGMKPEDYFKCSFVRNPYDRYVSVVEMIRLRSKPNADRFVFFDKLTKKIFNERFETLVDGAILKTQSKMIDMEIDFIGYYENLEEDYANLCEITGHAGDAYKLKNMNRSRILISKSYQEYYTEETANLILNHFEEDFDRFGYSKEL